MDNKDFSYYHLLPEEEAAEMDLSVTWLYRIERLFEHIPNWLDINKDLNDVKLDSKEILFTDGFSRIA